MRKGDLKENDSKFRSVEVTRAFQYNAALPDWRLDFGQIEWELGGERQSRLSGSLQPSIITKMNDPKQKWFSFSFDKQFVPCMEYWEMWPMLEQKDLWSGIVLGIRVWNLPFERSHADLAALFPTCLSVKNSFLTPQKLICQIFIKLRTEGIWIGKPKKMERPTSKRSYQLFG